MTKTEKNNIKPIATIGIGDNGIVKVMDIHYDSPLLCDRKCEMLDEDEEGVLVCGHEYVSNISNFQTRALVIEYQCILDKYAQKEWSLYEEYFKVIDNEGYIHIGKSICKNMLYPVKSEKDGHTLYAGTRANFVVYYPDFPKDGRVSSIVIYDYGKYYRCFFDDDSSPSENDSWEGIARGEHHPDNQRYPGDLIDRVESLEEAVRTLQDKVYQLTGESTKKDSTSESAPTDKSFGYKPIDKNLD